jgi:negative regulator of sigma-B (phosphoserine phosphatase)
VSEPSLPEGPYDWGVAARALAGEEESGDLSFFAPRSDGVLAAVVDGLGHGSEAAVAARSAVEVLADGAEEELDELVVRCHRALRHTRGAVMAILVAHPQGALTWTGVGNVESVIVRGARSETTAREHGLSLAGVLGMQIPKVQPRTVLLAPGDEVVLATDGIRQSFIDDLRVGAPQRIADDILERYATGHDDALVVVGRYQGTAT